MFSLKQLKNILGCLREKEFPKENKKILLLRCSLQRHIPWHKNWRNPQWKIYFSVQCFGTYQTSMMDVLRTRQWLVWKGLKYVSDWSNEFEREKSWLSVFKSSPPEVFLGKCVLKICNNFTGERPYRSVNRTSAWVFSCKFAAYFHIICS